MLPAGATLADVLTDTRVVVTTGEPSPDGSGFLASINNRPVIQNGQKIAFSGLIRDQFGAIVKYGIFRIGTDSQNMQLLVSDGQPLPDVDGNFNFAAPEILINDRNEIAFHSQVQESLGGSTEGVFFTDGQEDGLKIIARINQVAPGGTGIYWSLSEITNGQVTLNSTGQVGFGALVREGDEGALGRYRGNTESGTVTKIALAGESAPEGEFQGFWFRQSMNESGQMSFMGTVRIDNSQVDAIFRGNGVMPITEIVRNGDVEPGGDGKLSMHVLYDMHINDAGQIVFLSPLIEAAAGQVDNAAIYRADGTTITEIVRKADFTPDNNGRYLNLHFGVAMNNAGQVLFHSSVSGAAGDASAGLFLGDGSNIKQIMRLNDAAPGGGVFSLIGDRLGADLQMSLNELGHVVFTAIVNFNDGGQTPDKRGIFFYDGSKVILVARTGDEISGAGTITQITLSNFEGSREPERSPFNDLDQVVYSCSIGGQRAIAVWSPPLFADGFE